MKFIKLLPIFIPMLVLAYIAILNTTPFNTQVTYSTATKGLSTIGPSNRVQTANGISSQNDDLLYFTSTMPVKFQKAKVKVVFSNTDSSQELSFGFQDQPKWHYDTQVVDSPILNSVDWFSTSSNSPYLLQRVQSYASLQQLISDPPKNKIVGTYNIDEATLDQKPVTIPNYQPTMSKTVINTPLRGHQVLYVYLDNEAFDMNIEKKDLNWYDDPDVMNITVFKGSKEVMRQTIDDDGITDSSRRSVNAQSVRLSSAGKKLESGVYKIVIDAPSDTVTTNISTNLHKIVFESPVFPVSNKEVYGGVNDKTLANSLYTNSPILRLVTSHTSALQTVLVGANKINLNTVNSSITAKTDGSLSEINLPKSDTTISGAGYFSFTRDQFFMPTPYNILPIKTSEDIANTDFILTAYQKSKKVDNTWREAEAQFDLTEAFISKGKLSWVISAPGLKDSGKIIQIKDIQISFYKDGWI